MKNLRRNRLRKKLKAARKRHNPYAKIDWEKAAVLFRQSLPKTDKARRYPEVKEILHVLAAAGTVGLMFVAPGAGAVVGSMLLGNNSYRSWRTRQLLERLAKQKYVSVEEKDNGKVTVKITKQGMIRAITYELESMRLEKLTKWDGKWRVIIFDIPEKSRHVRDVFRMRLRQLGLYRLQESVYVSPYPCFNEVEFLRELYGVAFTVRYLLVEKLEDDAFLKRHFQLKD